MNVVNYNTHSKVKDLGFLELRISYISICWFLLALQLILSNVAKHSIYYQVSALLFMGFSFIYLFTRNAIKINIYYLITFIFIVYNLIIILLGDVVNSTHSLNMLKTISVNLIFFILIYSFLDYVNDTHKLLTLYVKVSVISNIIILFVFRDSLFTGRLAFSWDDSISNYVLLGIDVVTAGSNGIAYFSAIACFLSTYLFFSKGSKIYLFYNTLFIFTILSTGSRKGLLILVLGLFLLIIILNKISKKVIYGTISLVLIMFIYYLIMNVPTLYEVMGSRVEELLNLIFSDDVNDSSINTRMALINIAIAFFQERPIYGYGLDSFRIITPWSIISDNNFLEILVSSGIIGFLIYYSYVLFVLGNYITLKKKSNVLKMFFLIFILTLFLEYGSVTYFERNFGFVNAMLFYLLQKEKKEAFYATKEIKDT